MKRVLLPLWAYRYFVLSSIRTEFRSRFARSKLGGLWMILNPLAMVLIYALILSQIMSAKLPGITTRYAYPIYLLSGVIGWTLFSEVLGRCLNIFIDNGNLLKKMLFPKLALPLIVIGSGLVNFVLMFLAMFIVFGFLGHLPFHALHWIPLLVVITLGLAVGIGLFCGVLNVFMRDVGQIMNVVLQFWFWLTPIVYMLTIVPTKYIWLIKLNPMTGLVMGYHNVLLYNKAPDLTELIYPTFFAVFSLILAVVIFRKASEEMADVL
ncbi:ABC transporter permease [Vibrio cholerae]|uniref:ABC transporter permease n=1 Tax=Vibrio cholerae TaxID=666 RepID=UPI0011D40F0C|nr:ABC transporter permease [Vibrio cholerae]EGR0581297.1 ABC transporter permease [Vibrio cholerae]TXY76643.1 ABC transporter permease [Vibrio cholerae]BCN21214.1 putative O-antigen ABC transporter permease [Vibrio cholerae]BCN21877.1 putative O-antigen ABC transporter permease [Vibrio cholerae]GHX92013.1 ABC-2 type transporter family protein [Vibrio cholerae]